MPRPRTVSDQVILAAANALMSRSGPAGVTFASIAAETGLSPATLVQRYGSKEGLLRAALLQAWDQLDARTRALDETASLTPGGAVELLVALSDHGDHDQYAEGLLLLREDMRDPTLRDRGDAWGRALAEALGRRLLCADGPEARLLGGMMAAQWQGALLWWGFSREGALRTYVERRLKEWCRFVLKDGAGEAQITGRRGAEPLAAMAGAGEAGKRGN